MLRSAAPLGLVLALATSARAQDPDASIMAIDGAGDGTFVSVTYEGVLRRHDASGAVVEALGRAAPYDGQRAVHRVEVVSAGAIVASSDVVRVRAGASEVLVSEATLRQAGCGDVVDFAFAPDGRGALLAYERATDAVLVLAVDAGALRRVTTLPRPVHLHVAIDSSARWIAVLTHPSPAISGAARGGPLRVFDFATGRLRWEIAPCDGPTYGVPLSFSGSTLVTCARGAPRGEPAATLAGYDAASGRVRWSREVGYVFARSADGATLLVEDDGPALRLDAATGRARPLGASWVTAPLGGILLGASRIAVRQPDRPEPLVVELASAPWARAHP